MPDTADQIFAPAGQLWNKTKSDLTLAQTTYQRILALYKDSVVTSQRKDEVEAMYRAAQAAERAAYEQYQMAVDGAQSETVHRHEACRCSTKHSGRSFRPPCRFTPDSTGRRTDCNHIS